jgi:pSer/pThr/pTyr-binding forkhead associated (FHA) protein
MIKLQITEWGRTEEFLIYKNSIMIGSHSSNDLILMDKNLSKKLLCLTVQTENDVILQPYHYQGLYLNGIEVRNQSRVVIGDSIQIAETELKLIALDLKNPYIKSTEEVEQQLESFKEKTPQLKRILDYLDKVGRDV